MRSVATFFGRVLYGILFRFCRRALTLVLLVLAGWFALKYMI